MTTRMIGLSDFKIWDAHAKNPADRQLQEEIAWRELESRPVWSWTADGSVPRCRCLNGVRAEGDVCRECQDDIF